MTEAVIKGPGALRVLLAWRGGAGGPVELPVRRQELDGQHAQWTGQRQRQVAEHGLDARPSGSRVVLLAEQRDTVHVPDGSLVLEPGWRVSPFGEQKDVALRRAVGLGHLRVKQHPHFRPGLFEAEGFLPAQDGGGERG